MANRTKRTAKKDAAFFSALALGQTVRQAVQAAGLKRRTVYEWREADEAFAKGWDAAVDEGAEVLEQEAFRRAVEGIDHPVTYEGAITATYKEYSDTLLIFLLKARRPDKYRERVEQQVMHTGRVQVEFVGDWRGITN